MRRAREVSLLAVRRRQLAHQMPHVRLATPAWRLRIARVARSTVSQLLFQGSLLRVLWTLRALRVRRQRHVQALVPHVDEVFRLLFLGPVRVLLSSVSPSTTVARAGSSRERRERCNTCGSWPWAHRRAPLIPLEHYEPGERRQLTGWAVRQTRDCTTEHRYKLDDRQSRRPADAWVEVVPSPASLAESDAHI